jgi:hypothetical protein
MLDCGGSDRVRIKDDVKGSRAIEFRLCGPWQLQTIYTGEDYGTTTQREEERKNIGKQGLCK